MNRWSVRPSMAMLLLILLVIPREARAFVWRVAYNDAGRPANFQKTDVIRTIQQALREWEHGSAEGRVIARYDGEVTGVWSETDLIIIDWRPVPMGACAQTCLRTASGNCAGGVLRGELQLDNSGNCPNIPLFVPPLLPNGFVNRGSSLLAVLLHEFAHQFRDVNFDGPPQNNASVLSATVNDLANRHLWNDDHNNYPAFYGPHWHDIRFQLQDSGSHQIISSTDVGTGSAGNPRTPVAVSMADGAQGRNFTLAWAGRVYPATPALFIVQHNGTNAFNFQAMTVSQADTLKRPCVAVSGLHQVVVFSSIAQSPDTNRFDQLAGSRALLQVESHDGGFTFSTPATIAGLRTRQGISCAIDPATGQVVLAATGLDETINIAHRLPSAVGAGSWSAFTRVNAVGSFKVPQTRDVPEIVFDRFQATALGRLAWLEDATLTHRIGEVAFDGSSYQLNPLATPPIVERLDPTGFNGQPSYETLRTNPVMSFDGVPVFHLMTSFVSGMTAFSQWNYGSPSNNHLNVSWSFPPAPITWYTGAAQHPVQFATGTVQWMLLNPS